MELGSKRYRGFSARDLSIKKSSQTGPQLEILKVPFLEIRFLERKVYYGTKKKHNALLISDGILPGVHLHLSNVAVAGPGLGSLTCGSRGVGPVTYPCWHRG